VNVLVKKTHDLSKKIGHVEHEFKNEITCIDNC